MRNVKYLEDVKRTSCVKCACGTSGGILCFTAHNVSYFTFAVRQILHFFHSPFD